MKRLFCCLIIFLLCTTTALMEEKLSDQEITDILYELHQRENGGEDYLVLPEDYQAPVTGVDGIYRLLIVGIDAHEDLKGRSDTMVLAVLNTRKNSLKMVSFLRDLYVKIPGNGHNKLNASYSFGGIELLKKTLKSSFGVEIDGYITVNFPLLIRLIDEIGGVEIDVSQDELKGLNGILEYYNYLHERPQTEGRLENSGKQLLTGLQAMSYARIRKMDSDFERVKRQQRVLVEVYHRLLNLGVQKSLGIIVKYAEEVGTDIPMSKALPLLTAMSELKDTKIGSLQIPVNRGAYPAIIKKIYYIIPNFKKNSEELIRFLNEP